MDIHADYRAQTSGENIRGVPGSKDAKRCQRWMEMETHPAPIQRQQTNPDGIFLPNLEVVRRPEKTCIFIHD